MLKQTSTQQVEKKVSNHKKEKSSESLVVRMKIEK